MIGNITGWKDLLTLEAGYPVISTKKMVLQTDPEVVPKRVVVFLEPSQWFMLSSTVAAKTHRCIPFPGANAADNAAATGSPAWVGPAVASVDPQWPRIQYRLGCLLDEKLHGSIGNQIASTFDMQP